MYLVDFFVQFLDGYCVVGVVVVVGDYVEVWQVVLVLVVFVYVQVQQVGLLVVVEWILWVQFGGSEYVQWVQCFEVIFQ